MENGGAQKNTVHLVDPSDDTTAIIFKAMVVHGTSLSATPGRLYRQWKGEQVEESERWERSPIIKEEGREDGQLGSDLLPGGST